MLDEFIDSPAAPNAGDYPGELPLPTDASPLGVRPENAPTSPGKPRRGYVRKVSLSELAARRAAQKSDLVHFRLEGGYVWRPLDNAKWQKICEVIEPVSFVTSSDGYSLAVDVRLPDGTIVLMSPNALYAKNDVLTRTFERWAAWNLVDVPEPFQAARYVRDRVPQLRETRVDRTLHYSEEEEAASAALLAIWRKVTGRDHPI